MALHTLNDVLYVYVYTVRMSWLCTLQSRVLLYANLFFMYTIMYTFIWTRDQHVWNIGTAYTQFDELLGVLHLQYQYEYFSLQ